jgi:hypothetical protein
LNALLLAYDPTQGRAFVRDRVSRRCYLVTAPTGLATPVLRGLIDRDLVEYVPLETCPQVTWLDRFREGNWLTLIGVGAFFLFANYTGDKTEQKIKAKRAQRRAEKAKATEGHNAA